MAIIALGNVKYNDWIKSIWKPLLIMVVIAAIAIAIAVQLGYN